MVGKWRSCTNMPLQDDRITDSPKFKKFSDIKSNLNYCNSLPNNKIMDLTKLTAFAEHKINVGFLPQIGYKHCGNRNK